MDTEYKIYMDSKFSKLHEEVHDIAINVAEINQWKKDFDENKDDNKDKIKSKWNKFSISVVSITAVVAIIAILI